MSPSRAPIPRRPGWRGWRVLGSHATEPHAAQRRHLVVVREAGATYDPSGDDERRSVRRSLDPSVDPSVDGPSAPFDAGTESEPDVMPPALARLADLPIPDDPDDALDHPRDDHPFGLPVLSEVPQLAMLLQDLRKVDRLLADVIDALLELEDSGLAEATTGLGVDTWLTIVGRRTGADARMLHTTATVMRRVPTLLTAFRAGQVSWAQVRSVVLAVRPLPRTFDEPIDAAVADAINNAGPDTEPDALTRTIRWHLAALDPGEIQRDETEAEQAEYLAMQPRLDGTGGRIWGELGATRFAILDAALNQGPTGSAATEGTDDGDAGTDAGTDEDPAEHPIRTAGRERLARLIGHLERSMSTRLVDDSGGPPDTPSGTSGSMRARPQLLLRTELSTLLDRDQTPAALLTTLLGGHVRVTAETARTLIDRRGADLRTIVIDDTGTVVGVGRRTRITPGWLNDATLALHDTCAHPGCEIAARASETDHARPWHPVRSGDEAGRTDIDQLGPGCKHHNRTKEAAGWVVTQQPDGSRRWHHPRTGLTTRTLPVPRPRPGAAPGP